MATKSLLHLFALPILRLLCEHYCRLGLKNLNWRARKPIRGLYLRDRL